MALENQKFWGRCSMMVAAVLLFLATSGQLWAGKYNPKLSVGDESPAFEGLEGVDGKKYSLADFKEKKVIVLAFTCNTCPYAVDYEDRLADLAKKFDADGTGVVIAINANQVENDLLPAMKARAEEKKFPFLYLHDATQQVAKSYGATYTPEFVVLDADRKVVYLGAMDDSPDGKKIEKRYIEDAIAAILAGKTPEVAETPAVGCAVRYVRERRTKK